jgi:1-acyl-sn-glycerol-3-phosphate acyltransferase
MSAGAGNTTISPEVSTPKPGSAPPPVHHIPTHLRYLTMLLCVPLMAIATAAFGCISLLCGLWDKSGRRFRQSASSGQRS